MCVMWTQNSESEIGDWQNGKTISKSSKYPSGHIPNPIRYKYSKTAPDIMFEAVLYML